MNDELFTATVPTINGDYWYKVDRDARPEVVYVEPFSNLVMFHGHEGHGTLDPPCGLFGPRIPTPEQCREIQRLEEITPSRDELEEIAKHSQPPPEMDGVVEEKPW